MARKLSRRVLSDYIVSQLLSGVKAKKIAEQVAAYLVQNRRTKEYGLIIKDVEYELLQRGIATARVTSAFKLGQSAMKDVESLVRSTGKITSVNIEEYIDPSVIGGIKLELPGKELDNTIARKLTGLRTNYKKA